MGWTRSTLRFPESLWSARTQTLTASPIFQDEKLREANHSAGRIAANVSAVVLGGEEVIRSVRARRRLSPSGARCSAGGLREAVTSSGVYPIQTDEAA